MTGVALPRCFLPWMVGDVQAGARCRGELSWGTDFHLLPRLKNQNLLSLVGACSISGRLLGWCSSLSARVWSECAELSREGSCSCPVAQQELLRRQPQAGVCRAAGATGCAGGVAARPLMAWLKVSRVTCPADFFFFFFFPCPSLSSPLSPMLQSQWVPFLVPAAAPLPRAGTRRGLRWPAAALPNQDGGVMQPFIILGRFVCSTATALLLLASCSLLPRACTLLSPAHTLAHGSRGSVSFVTTTPKLLLVCSYLCSAWGCYLGSDAAPPVAQGVPRRRSPHRAGQLGSCLGSPTSWAVFSCQGDPWGALLLFQCLGALEINY